MQVDSIVLDGLIFCEMAGLISSARKSVDLCAYVIEASATAWCCNLIVTSINTVLARGSVEVRIISSMSQNWLYEQQHNMWKTFVSQLVDPYGMLHVSLHKHHLFNIMHCKMLIIDGGRRAALMTCNVEANVCDSTSNLKNMMLTFTDVPQFQHVYGTIWGQGTVVADLPSGKHQNSQNGQNNNNCLKNFEQNYYAIDEYQHHTRLLYQPSCALTCHRNTRHSPLNDSILDMINVAKKTIDIITPNFNDMRIIKLLQQKVHREKVRVRIVLTLGFNRDAVKQIFAYTNQQIVKKYTGTFLFYPTNVAHCNIDNLECKINVSTAAPLDSIHTKLMIVDGVHIHFGSTNFDVVSSTSSAECNVEIYSASEKLRVAFVDIFNTFV